MIRAVQVGLGPVGRAIASDLVERRLGRLVGAVDPALAGRPLAELVPGAPADVVVRASVEEPGALDGAREALVATASRLPEAAETLRPLVARGLAIVSTCEELAWPWLRHPVLAQELEESAVRAGARVLGAGVNPGFLMDAFAVAATTVCRRVRAVRVTRAQDAGPRREPFLRKIGAGLEPAELERRAAAGELGHVGLGESLHLVAHALGLRLERWDEEATALVAERELACALGPIPPGRAAGLRQVARGHAGGAVPVELVFEAAVGLAEPRDRVEVDGDPPVDLVWRGGVHGDVATAAVVLNSVRSLRRLPPGLHTAAAIAHEGCAPPPAGWTPPAGA